MIEKDEIAEILRFVSEYWDKLKNEPENEALKMLPSKFWMKSLGGPVGNKDGPIVGFAKGGPLEKYKFELDFEDKNHGKNNTIFLEPVAIKNGYWGFHGGREIRQLFMMQVQSQGYKFMTSFSMRDVIEERKKKEKNVVFVKKFDPERWDYFRVVL